MKTCFLVSLFLSTINLQAQDYPTYRLYSLDEFAREHVGNLETFMKQFYSKARYSAIARENSLEGKFDVMIFNHSDSAFEIRLGPPSPFFNKNILDALSRMRESWVHTDIPFIVNFCVEYKLVSKYEQHPTLDSTCTIQILAYRIYEKPDTSYIFNANEITTYPKIMGYPGFIKSKRQLRKYSLDSVESLVEAAIKSCCNKKISLTQTPPCNHCEYSSSYVPKGHMSIVFHSKGYISKISLHGQLKKKIYEAALLRTLQSIRFQPAQSRSVPAHLVLEYRME